MTKTAGIIVRTDGRVCNPSYKISLTRGLTTMGRLTDKNILVTGGNSGIGLAVAQEFDSARVADMWDYPKATKT